MTRSSSDPRGGAASLLGALLVAAAVSGCSGRVQEAPLPEPPPSEEGPRVEVRLARRAEVRLVLPPRIRVSLHPGGELLFEGESADLLDPVGPSSPPGREPTTLADPPGVPDAAEPPVRVDCRAEGDRIFLGRYSFPGAISVSSAAEGAAELALVDPESVAAPRPHAYRGDLVLEQAGGELRVSSAVSLEQYLAGVVGAEMPASYPIEALKAQAVAARTYTLRALRDAAARNRRPVFAADESFQVYRGLDAEHPRVLRAVRETAGEVLTYQGKVLRAYFHAACGGSTADAREVFDEPDLPPFQGVRCGECDGAPGGAWEARWSPADLAAALRPWLASRGVSVGDLRSVEVVDRTSDGRARYLRIAHAAGSFEILATRLRALVGVGGPRALKSTRFDIAREGEVLVFRGSGRGHGVGLCQVGAGRLGARCGHAEILARYYPESVLVRDYAAGAEEEAARRPPSALGSGDPDPGGSRRPTADGRELGGASPEPQPVPVPVPVASGTEEAPR